MARQKTTKPTGAELRAMRDQRLEAGPAAEASRRERSFLAGLNGAQADFDWLIENAAWTQLGFESVLEWWNQRVRPLMLHLEMRPTEAMVEKILAKVREVEKALPRSQRTTQRQLTDALLSSEWKVRGRTETRNRRSAAVTDLGQTDIVDAEIVEDASTGVEEPPVEAPQTAAGEVSSADLPADGAEGVLHSPDDVPAPGPVPAGIGDGPGVTPQTTAGPTVATTAVDSSRIEGSPGEGSGVRPDPSPLDHPGAKPGEASAGLGRVPASGARSRLREGEKTAGVQVSPEPGAPAVAQDQELIEWVHDLIDVISRVPEPTQALDLPQDLNDALLNALVDLDEWRDDVDNLKTGGAR